MALNFPANPQDGDEYGKYVYNAAKNVWSSSATPPRYLVSQNVPSTANNGDVWFNTSTARSYIYYEDADSSQWVEIGGAEGAVGTPSELGDIPGIDLTGLADGKTLVYDAANSEWIPGEAGGKFTVSDTAPSEAENGDTWFKSDDGKTYIYYVDTDGGQWVEIASNTTGYLDIGQLNDVTIVSPTTGQALTYDGSGWVNATPASTLGSLTDVSDSAPADGQALVYNDSSGEWEPGAVATSGVNVADSDTISIDFSDTNSLIKRAVAGDVTITASGYTAGASKKIYFAGDTVKRSLSFPAGWKFTNTLPPTHIGSEDTNILQLDCFGTTESDIVAQWVGPYAFEPMVAVGGTVTTSEVNGVTYKIHTFDTSGTFEVQEVNDSNTVEYLVVAGGGGGGCWVGAGAGAGGMLTGTSNLSVASYPVLVGAGGKGAYNPGGYTNLPGSNSAAQGGQSSFNSITTSGGGIGMSWDAEGPGSGGSGGGSSTTSAGGSGAVGQGNAGGAGRGGAPYETGGGGGAGAVGQTWTAGQSGDGGAGLASSISGLQVYYAGGGGGGAHDASPTPGSGGVGGGGSGISASTTKAGNGQVNTGGGGGGAGNTGGDPSEGGNGGSGMVIIRYPITDPN